MLLIAWKNLIKEKTRLAITLIGITFAVVLMFFDLGAYLGFVRDASVLIDNSAADVWITIENSLNFDSSRPFPERRLWKVRQSQSVEWAEPVSKGWGVMKLKEGGAETVMLVGFNPEAPLGWPWKLKEGSAAALKRENTIIIDESAQRKLGGLRVGDRVEIADTRVEVVGISQEVKSFTTSPIAFASYETAKQLSGIYRMTGSEQVSFILVKPKPGVSASDLVKMLSPINGVDVFTREDLSWKTRQFWVVRTGMGIGFGLTAALGFLVGMVIVGQTIYASTMEHLGEFGTLKAIGATNRDLAVIIIYQVFIVAILGYLIGLGITRVTREGYQHFGLNFAINPSVELAMFGVTLAMCLGSSILSARRAFRIDPAIVFRG